MVKRQARPPSKLACFCRNFLGLDPVNKKEIFLFSMSQCTSFNRSGTICTSSSTIRCEVWLNLSRNRAGREIYSANTSVFKKSIRILYGISNCENAIYVLHISFLSLELKGPSSPFSLSGFRPSSELLVTQLEAENKAD